MRHPVALALRLNTASGWNPALVHLFQRILFIALAAVSLLAAAFTTGSGDAHCPPWPFHWGAAWRRHCGSTVAATNPVHALTFADKVIGFLGVDTRWPGMV